MVEPRSATTRLLVPRQHKASCFLLRISKCASSAYTDSWLASIVLVLFGGRFSGFVLSAAWRTGTTSGSLRVQGSWPCFTDEGMDGFLVGPLKTCHKLCYSSSIKPPISTCSPLGLPLGFFVLTFYIFAHLVHVGLVNRILSKVKNDTLGRGLQGWSS